VCRSLGSAPDDGNDDDDSTVGNVMDNERKEDAIPTEMIREYLSALRLATVDVAMDVSAAVVDGGPALHGIAQTRTWSTYRFLA
jgi:hypothetical protein